MMSREVKRMIYGKLPIILLSAMASEADGSKECLIAHYILSHRSEAADMSIVALAERCHVSVSSISRFCRALGLSDFAELRALIRRADWHYEPASRAPSPEQRVADTLGLLHASLDRAASSVDMKAIDILCRKIDAYERVALFGLLKAGTAAQCLQADLLLQDKVTVCKLPLSQQMEYMERADERDLILIFSYSGIYFDYLSKRMPEGLHRAHVVFITGAQGVKSPCIDQLIRFDSDLSQASHPLQMQLMAALIAQEYAHLRRNREGVSRI